MIRKSISCMAAGLLIAVTAWFFAYAWMTDWYPHKIVPIAAVVLGVIGIAWLYDEITDRTGNPRGYN